MLQDIALLAKLSAGRPDIEAHKEGHDNLFVFKDDVGADECKVCEEDHYLNYMKMRAVSSNIRQDILTPESVFEHIFIWMSRIVSANIFTDLSQHVNVALTGTAIQSSYLDRKRWYAQRAIDNCTLQTIESDCCSLTKPNLYKEAWWRLDLGLVMTIQDITIYYRNDFLNRFGGYSLYVSNSTAIPTQEELCYKDNSILLTDVNLNPTHVCPSVARYVTVYNRRETPKTRDWYDDFAVLELCEVQVFGCPIGVYGYGKCTNRCSSKCFGGNCNAATGHCFYCTPGFFGTLCTHECPRNCKDKICTQDTGVCLDCEDGFFGPSCLPCSTGCIDPVCNKTSGNCDFCEDGFFSPLCSPCSSGCVDTVCNKTSGNCDTCLTGFYGSDCTQTCPVGCEDRCDKATGACLGCLNGKYGLTCDRRCSDQCKNGKCTQLHGKCEDNINVAAIGIGTGCGLVIVVLVVVIIVMVRRNSRNQADGSKPNQMTDMTEMDGRRTNDPTYYGIGESGPHEVDSDRYEGLDPRTVEQPHAYETVQIHL
ncbi:uncharacterized protein [Argopecten irradians]|uniref:uncharacterized protein n=1 Tax=Argopecten irradians TaxID=31199 RepID=UPI00370FAF4A